METNYVCGFSIIKSVSFEDRVFLDFSFLKSYFIFLKKVGLLSDGGGGEKVGSRLRKKKKILEKSSSSSALLKPKCISVKHQSSPFSLSL